MHHFCVIFFFFFFLFILPTHEWVSLWKFETEQDSGKSSAFTSHFYAHPDHSKHFPLQVCIPPFTHSALHWWQCQTCRSGNHSHTCTHTSGAMLDSVCCLRTLRQQTAGVWNGSTDLLNTDCSTPWASAVAIAGFTQLVFILSNLGINWERLRWGPNRPSDVTLALNKETQLGMGETDSFHFGIFQLLQE